MQDLETQDLEVRVLNYLSQFKNVHTKTMYKALSVKPTYNLSLNKFRIFMYELEKLGKLVGKIVTLYRLGLLSETSIDLTLNNL